MNKKEAKELASRAMADWIGEFLSRNELVYDQFCDDSLHGRRLSERDKERVVESIEEMQEKFCRAGLDHFIEKKDRRIVPADGRPGYRSTKWRQGLSYVEGK